jgi:hypothetical protein
MSSRRRHKDAAPTRPHELPRLHVASTRAICEANGHVDGDDLSLREQLDEGSQIAGRCDRRVGFVIQPDRDPALSVRVDAYNGPHVAITVPGSGARARSLF